VASKSGQQQNVASNQKFVFKYVYFSFSLTVYPGLETACLLIYVL